MEDVLEVYTRLYDPRFPQVGMDEGAKQLLLDKRESLPVQPGRPERVDYTFEAAGMCKLFLACEPLAGKRVVPRDRAPDERRLGLFYSRTGGCSLSRCREDRARDGPSEYPHPLCFVSDLSAG